MELTQVRSGSLLVSSVELVEQTFRRTVIYVIEHNELGSLGVVLNRPSDTAVHDVLPGWAPHTVRPQALFVGGPVKRDSALCLGLLRPGADADGVSGLRPVHGRVVMVDLDAEPDELAPVLEGVRIFVGYAGWSAGQLEAELEREDWLVVPALPSDVVVPGRVDLWGRVLRRQPMPMALLATHPIELERN
ncbi:YqgE/AlgH family protein [Rhodococcus sp. X156]|uniref:YqgE/AlgH family protein n=1 Tax=Rhodococcus sp. X156 TaxID=2499145 RepID=UPI000FDC21A5|nr:YqgE/AlgH family protein [Rhodococcus sp. X156]